MDQLEEFDVKAYVCRLLGKRDWSFLVDEVREAVPVDQQIELLESPMKKILPSGNFKPSQKSVTRFVNLWLNCLLFFSCKYSENAME
ncbi:Signal recognition particle 54 kDa protein 3 [Camellia lanceoleosa]|uniref:Signal recognition particle 54 kDa protein 3 n=1 Tax=Camellia lanceoleosa TaxID=1840588 RepID=A0ACC0G3U5_9ERIC|nr:Signal recognition particle 54 kDa protein 3 [Camellia lanceoleosa]